MGPRGSTAPDVREPLRAASAPRPVRAARRAADTLDETEKELLLLLEKQAYVDFMRLAVNSRKNILVSGPTGSGKTTYTKALIREIPADERLITIEDAKELVLDRHPNHVRLFYSKDDQGLARFADDFEHAGFRSTVQHAGLGGQCRNAPDGSEVGIAYQSHERPRLENAGHMSGCCFCP